MKIIDWNIKNDTLRTWIRPVWIWRIRKDIFKETLLTEHPDIFCAQEARKHQVDFFTEFLSGYSYIGSGREDGKESGEYNPIFFNTNTLDLLEDGQFWLSKTPDIPSKGWDTYPRICTWGKFREKKSGKIFLTLNTHLPLAYNLSGKKHALTVIEKQISSLEKNPTILTGDLNSRPSSATWNQIYDMGFQKNIDTHITHRIFGIPAFCYDAIFTTPEWEIIDYRILKNHRRAVYPSDHFGVCAEVALKA